MADSVTGSVILKRGREKSLEHHHPWIFSGAVETVKGNPPPGATVRVIDAGGRAWGLGAFSPQSQIIVRMWSFNPEETIDEHFLRLRLEQAFRRRSVLGTTLDSNALRLVNAESDGLPGIIIDRYADYLVLQLLSAGAEYWQQEIISLLTELQPVAGIYERSDVEVRHKEGLTLRSGLLWGQQPPALVPIEENGIKFLVDIRNGHKTGFYLDQRQNRQLLAAFCHYKTVLNCFAYTGGFGVYALKGGARAVTNIDTSAEALSLLERQLNLNNLPQQLNTNINGDVFQVLRQLAAQGRKYDLIVLDPPKFAESKQQVMRAARGYKDINLWAMKLLNPGGVLFTFSCSGMVSSELFQKIVADAALDAGRKMQIVGRLTQAPDHPVELQFPEGSYLKGLICLAD